jgi:hypothetical protein
MRRWTSSYHFAWTPIVNFSSRRLRFLDWVEAHIAVEAFTERTDSVGIAVGHRSIRLTANGSGMVLSDGLGQGLTPLMPAVEGLLAVMEPRDLVLMHGATAWSQEVTGGTYDEARAGLAQRVAGMGSLTSGLEPADCAVLMDYRSEAWSALIEWGLVDAMELRQRLEEPSHGQLPSLRPAVHLDQADSILPEVSFFVDTHVTSELGIPVTTWGDTETAMSQIASIAEELAESAYARVAHGEMQSQ